ncbi:MAG: peptidase T [Clostridia bacterium]|nr:peptidase T [Clostridia bacterium]
MNVTERFLSYVRYATPSSETSGLHPSNPKERDFAEVLAKELKAVGLSDAKTDEHGYVTAHLPASAGLEGAPVLGFIAHMDTSPDFSGAGVSPILHENYDGGDLPLGNSGRVLSVRDFPHLRDLSGRTLITSDGTTLLGADDKAGIAEIVTALETLIGSGKPHGRIAICFTPDEEIGEGADFFDLKEFGADYAYTSDGSAEGEIEYENFNAAGAHFEIRGVNVHPGSAKGIMVNAGLIASEIASALPKDEIPAKTEGYEGFFHLTGIGGTVERATLDYIVRDHDAKTFEKRLAYLRSVEKEFREKYGEGAVTPTVKEQYRNMKEIIDKVPFLIEYAREAVRRVGVAPIESPIRGGTDGARLSFMGLPCPNLGTGGYAFHGPFEHITVEGMEKSVGILVELCALFADRK